MRNLKKKYFQFDNSKTIRMVQYYKNCHFSIIENVSGGGLEGFQVHLGSLIDGNYFAKILFGQNPF